MMTIDSFKIFASENLTKLPHPSQNKEILFQDVNELVDLLFRFLSHEIDEPSLTRVKDNFEINFQKIFELKLRELPNSIENLATNFESFLRKIAYIKYKGTIFWTGDETHEGIHKSTLADLIAGDLPVKPTVIDDTIPRKRYPEALINRSGTAGAILEFVREKLRNAVHYAKNYSRTQLVEYSNLVLGVYLLAVRDNKLFLKKKFFPEYNYLESILNNQELVRVNNYYVELFGIENLVVLDNIAIEVLDGNKLVASIENIFNEEEEDIEKDSAKMSNQTARVDSVLNIAKDTNRFIIIGEPGSGKTTTLLKIQYENASQLLNGNSNYRVPVYLTASSYSQHTTFKDLICSKLDFGAFDEILSNLNLVILVDGLNEINEDVKIQATNELKSLMNDYPNVAFILSSRNFSFFNHWNIDVYELKDLNESQIKQLITNIRGNVRGENLWKQISLNKQIFELCHNPLMLMMVMKVSSITGGNIPPNKGVLYQLFNDAILAREKKIYTTSPLTKKNILSHLAFWMRQNGLFRRVNIDKAKSVIEPKLKILDTSIGINEILDELIDNNFLNLKEEHLEFIHETYQEYYVALEIKEQFYKRSDFDFDYSEEKWFEPIIICSDLFNNDDDRTRFFELIFIGNRFDSAKKLEDLSTNDINQKFTVACKVAFNLKQIHPLLYAKAEKIVENYLIIWSYQKSRNIDILPFELLIEGIASLSSQRVITKLFNKLKYLSAWFYNKEYDERTEDYSGNINFENKFASLSKVFAENLADFEFVYLLLFNNLKNNKYWISKSINSNIRRFKKYLLQSTANAKLISTFKNVKNKELLKQIGKSDLDFFIENFSQVSDKIEGLYEFVLNNHKKSSFGQDFLLKSLKNNSLKIELKLAICQGLLSQPECLHQVLTELATLVNQNETIVHYDTIRKILNAMSIDILQRYGLLQLYSYPGITERKFIAETEVRSNGELVLQIPNTTVPVALVKKNLANIICQGKALNLVFKSTLVDNSKFLNTIVIAGDPEIINEALQQHANGGQMSMHVREFKADSPALRFKYLQLIPASSSNKVHLVVDESTLKVVTNLYRPSIKIDILIDNKLMFTIQNFARYNLTYSSVTVIDSDYLLETISKNQLELTMLDIDIDFSKPFSYHADLLKEKEFMLKHIDYNVKNEDEAKDFVIKLGLSSFTKSLEVGKRYAVILSIKKFELHYDIKLYDIEENKVISLVTYKNMSEFIANEIVVLEKNNTINKPLELPEDFFEKSEIIFIEPNKKEGFIRSSRDKDFYFSYQYADFEPRLYDKVKFIPGFNFHPDYHDMPFAYCVQKLAEPSNTAKLLSFKIGKDYYNLFLKQSNSTQELFSRVRNFELNRIKNFSGKFQKDQVFRFYVQHEKESSKKLPRVVLIEMIE